MFQGSTPGEMLDLEGRLLYPMVAGQRVGWEQALDTVAARFTEVIERHGPDAVAFYVSGQLLTEDYYVANKLMKGFIGFANVDTNSRLCMTSSVAGHRRAFGSDAVPGCYEDWEQAELLVLTGSNTAWCHPVLYQRAYARTCGHAGGRAGRCRTHRLFLFRRGHKHPVHGDPEFRAALAGRDRTASAGRDQRRLLRAGTARTAQGGRAGGRLSRCPLNRRAEPAPCLILNDWRISAACRAESC